MADRDDPELNGDLSVQVTVHSQDLAWTASPSATVWRKRLHRVGSAEAGQVGETELSEAALAKKKRKNKSIWDSIFGG